MSDLTAKEITRAYKAVDSELPTNSIAISLLEGTGEDFEIQRHRSGYSVGFIRFDWLEHDPDLLTAAVRAVNAWAESRERKTP